MAISGVGGPNFQMGVQGQIAPQQLLQVLMVLLQAMSQGPIGGLGGFGQPGGPGGPCNGGLFQGAQCPVCGNQNPNFGLGGGGPWGPGGPNGGQHVHHHHHHHDGAGFPPLPGLPGFQGGAGFGLQLGGGGLSLGMSLNLRGFLG
ncbi:MAG: hypothetical protein HY319_23035 [Armatimonadetes bacterium]|nr:hypothetical protein [Armatimonadota bacterium]